MRLRAVGQWPHPCGPWLASSSDALFPSGRGTDPNALLQRLAHLRQWTPSENSAGLLAKVTQTQGPLVGDALQEVLEGHASVILTGQQPSLAGGPLFVWLKAWEAIAQARAVSQSTGTKVYPLFWIAGDDSDLDEVRYLANPELQQSVDAHVGVAPGAPVGELAIPVEHAERLAASVSQWWPNSELPSLLRAGQSLSQILMACLRNWFGEELIVVDAAWGELRSQASAVYGQFLTQVEEVHTALEQGMEQAQALNLPVGLRSWSDRARVFAYTTTGRTRWEYREGFWFGGNGQKLSYSELRALLVRNPEQFSHDVVSRPFAAEAIFPVLAHVLGPGEMGYFACLGTLAQTLERPLAPVFARASATILPKLPQNLVQEVEWDVGRYKPQRWEVWEQLLLRKRDVGLADWKNRQEVARAAYAQTLDLEPSSASAQALQKTLSLWERRAERTRLRSLRKAHETDLQTLRSLWNLAHGGGLQERIWSPWALQEALHSPELLRQLGSQLQWGMTSHQVWEVA